MSSELNLFQASCQRLGLPDEEAAVLLAQHPMGDAGEATPLLQIELDLAASTVFEDATEDLFLAIQATTEASRASCVVLHAVAETALDSVERQEGSLTILGSTWRAAALLESPVEYPEPLLLCEIQTDEGVIYAPAVLRSAVRDDIYYLVPQAALDVVGERFGLDLLASRTTGQA